MKSEHLRALSVSTLSSQLALRGSTRLDHWALGRIQQAVAPSPLRFVLWDGYAIGPDDRPIATITVKNRTALYKWLWNPDLNFGEGYMSGAVEVRGDLVRDARGGLSRDGRLAAASLVDAGAEQHAERVARERPPSLRHRQRLLPALARSTDAVHLRLLPDARRDARRRRRSPRWRWCRGSCG